MKENLLLLKNLLEPWRIKFTNIWLQFQICIYWKLNDSVDKFNTYHRTMKIKLIDVTKSTCTESDVEHTDWQRC